MTEEQRPADPPFRAISPQEYANLDPTMKAQIVRTRHLGIIRSSEVVIRAQLLDALKNPRQMPDGTTRPYRHEELVVVLMHRDDPITPPPLRESWFSQNLEVGIFVSERPQFAQSLLEFQMRMCSGCNGWYGDDQQKCEQCGVPATASERLMKPYMRSGRTLQQPLPDKTIAVAVFDMGMSTITFIGFDPDNPDAETVPADPNVKPPPAVDPIPVAPPKAPSALPSSGTPSTG